MVASVINTIAIQTMNYLFQYVARFQQWENRTDVEHYNNLILKLISFNFCNYNIRLFIMPSSRISGPAGQW